MYLRDPFTPLDRKDGYQKDAPAGADPPAKDSGGRPRALDDAKRREICALLVGGFSLQEAARYVRCGLRTIRREASRNPEFKANLRHSQLESQIRPLRMMNHSMATNWRATAWMLERTGPERFARRSPAALTPQHSRALANDMFRVIREEISDPAQRKRIQQRLRLIVECAIHRALVPGRAGRRQRQTIIEAERTTPLHVQPGPSTPAADVDENVTGSTMPPVANTGEVLTPADAPRPETSQPAD